MADGKSFEIPLRDRDDAIFEPVKCDFDDDGDLVIWGQQDPKTRWRTGVAREDIAAFIAGLQAMMEAGK